MSSCLIPCMQHNHDFHVHRKNVHLNKFHIHAIHLTLLTLHYVIIISTLTTSGRALQPQMLGHTLSRTFVRIPSRRHDPFQNRKHVDCDNCDGNDNVERPRRTVRAYESKINCRFCTQPICVQTAGIWHRCTSVGDNVRRRHGRTRISPVVW